MLGIILMILKVIGLLLLCILGLFLALVLLILFVPIPYRVWINGDTGEPASLEYRIKVFGIQFFPPKKRSKQKRKRIVSKQQTGAQQMQAGTPQNPETPQIKQPVKESKPINKNNKLKQQKASKASKVKKKEKVPGRDVRGMLDRLRTEFTDEGNRRALRHVLSEIRYVLRHLGPRRVRADVSFSLGDPANTGYATAALSVCPFSYGKGCRVIPDFESEQIYLRGWLDLRGHARMVHVLITGVRLLIDKDIRRIIRKILKKKQQ